jgi:hypothetical protein
MLAELILTTPALLDDVCGPCGRDEAAFALSAIFGNRLVWLHEQGVGYLNVTDAPYDADYFAKYAGYAATAQGRAITQARIDMVYRHGMLEIGDLTDVGIGCGDFISGLQETTATIRVYGSDINPAGVDWLARRGCFRDPYETEADALTFWDALEHIPDVERMIANAQKFVFCSLPIVPGDGPPRNDWKHYRADEHCWYFTRKGFIGWMRAQGFQCIECSAAETLLGRDDIESFAFRRVE